MGDVRPISAADDSQAVVETILFAADATTAGELGNILHRLGRTDAQTMPGGCAAAIRWCRAQRASMVIVDLDGEAVPLRAVAELASHCDPTCRIIALGTKADIDLYRSLLHGGVFDYLQKPVRLDLLASVLERADGNASGDFTRIGRSIAVTGCAGGLGTSVVAAGLAQILSDIRRMPVAMVDFDLRKGDQGLLLGVSGDAGLGATLVSREIDVHLLQRAMIAVNPRLKLLAQEPTSVPVEIDGEHLLTLGATLCQLFNQVIWDLPAGHPVGAMHVLHHSEIRILLTDLSVQGARATQRLLADIGDESDGQQLLLVHNPSHGAAPGLPREQFEDYVGRRLDLALPYMGNALNEGLLHGPLALKRCPALQQGLLDLADLAAGRKPQARSETGLFGRLKQAIVRRAA